VHSPEPGYALTTMDSLVAQVLPAVDPWR
jgi:hypothetical protein